MPSYQPADLTQKTPSNTNPVALPSSEASLASAQESVNCVLGRAVWKAEPDRYSSPGVYNGAKRRLNVFLRRVAISARVTRASGQKSKGLLAQLAITLNW